MSFDWPRRFKLGGFDVELLAWSRAKILWSAWIAGIAQRRSVPNTETVCFSIGSSPPSHIQAIPCVWNDSKTRNLGFFVLKSRDADRCLFECTQLLQLRKIKGLSCHRYKWWKWIHYSNPTRTKSRKVLVLLPHCRVSLKFSVGRMSSLVGGTRAVFFTTIGWKRETPRLGNGIDLNCCHWAENCTKRGQNTSRG